jgi:frataxin
MTTTNTRQRDFVSSRKPLTCDGAIFAKLQARTGAASQHPAPPSMSLRRVTRLALALARASSRDVTAPPASTTRASTSTHLAAWSARASRHGLAGARCAFVSARRPAPGDSPGLRAKHHASSPVCSFSTASEDTLFHRVADEMLENLQDRVEQWGEDADLDDFDFAAEAGVVTIALGDGKGTYVINKQGPNRQIWVSSPVSGPLRYDYHEGTKTWVYKRDGSAMHERLRDELVSAGGGELDLEGLNE